MEEQKEDGMKIKKKREGIEGKKDVYCSYSSLQPSNIFAGANKGAVAGFGRRRSIRPCYR
jgi:hypothetical protein